MSERYRVDVPEYAGDAKIKTWDGDKMGWRDITPDERVDALEDLVLEMYAKLRRLGQ